MASKQSKDLSLRSKMERDCEKNAEGCLVAKPGSPWDSHYSLPTIYHDGKLLRRPRFIWLYLRQGEKVLGTENVRMSCGNPNCWNPDHVSKISKTSSPLGTIPKNSKALVKSEDSDMVKLTTEIVKSEANLRTRRTYSSRILLILRWHKSQSATPRITSDSILKYRDQLIADGKAPATVNAQIRACKYIANQLTQRELMTHAEYLRIKAIKEVKGAKNPDVGNRLTYEQVERVIDCSMSAHYHKRTRNRALVALLFLTGLRRSEAAALDWSMLRRAENQYVFTNVPVKGGTMNVAVPKRVEALLHSMLHMRDFPESGSVFSLKSDGIREVLALAARRSGITFAPHDTRRTFAVLAYRAGIGIKQISLNMGHANIETTERYIAEVMRLSKPPGDAIVQAAADGTLAPETEIPTWLETAEE